MKNIVQFILKIISEYIENKKSNKKVIPEVKPKEVEVTPKKPFISTTSEDYKFITSLQFSSIVPSVTLAKVNDLLNALNKAMQEFSINTPIRQCAFIAQTAHESAGYAFLIENLNYSAQALINTWPSRFTAKNAPLYARQQQKIANYVYSNRLGNGNEASGDGWKYRGRGIIQITGKDNYRNCGVDLGLDLVTSPELLEQLEHAFRSGAWFWNSRKLNDLADKEDFVRITKAINGGTIGLEDRMKYYTRAKTALGVI